MDRTSRRRPTIRTPARPLGIRHDFTYAAQSAAESNGPVFVSRIGGEKTSRRDLGLLKRDKKLQVRYEAWAKEIKEEYGSMGQHDLIIDLLRKAQ